MLDGDNQGTAINQKFQLAPPRTHPPPPNKSCEHLSDMWLSTSEIGTAQLSLLHSRSCVWTDQTPYPVWFLWPRKSYIRYGVHIVIPNALRNGVDNTVNDWLSAAALISFPYNRCGAYSKAALISTTGKTLRGIYWELGEARDKYAQFSIK